jgi:hypothetical protein
MKKYRVLVYAERLVRGKICLKTKANDPEDAKERIRNYLDKAGYDLELSPGQFVSDSEQDGEYKIGHVIDAEEVTDVV